MSSPSARPKSASFRLQRTQSMSSESALRQWANRDGSTGGGGGSGGSVLQRSGSNASPLRGANGRQFVASGATSNGPTRTGPSRATAMSVGRVRRKSGAFDEVATTNGSSSGGGGGDSSLFAAHADSKVATHELSARMRAVERLEREYVQQKADLAVARAHLAERERQCDSRAAQLARAQEMWNESYTYKRRELKTRQQEIDALERGLGERELLLREAAQEVTAKRRELRQQLAEADAAREEVERLRAQLESHNAEVGDKLRDLETLENEVRNREREVTLREEDACALEAELVERLAEVERRETELVELHDTLVAAADTPTANATSAAPRDRDPHADSPQREPLEPVHFSAAVATSATDVSGDEDRSMSDTGTDHENQAQLRSMSRDESPRPPRPPVSPRRVEKLKGHQSKHTAPTTNEDEKESPAGASNDDDPTAGLPSPDDEDYDYDTDKAADEFVVECDGVLDFGFKRADDPAHMHSRSSTVSSVSARAVESESPRVDTSVMRGGSAKLRVSSSSQKKRRARSKGNSARSRRSEKKVSGSSKRRQAGLPYNPSDAHTVEAGVEVFNRDPKRGIEFLREAGVLDGSPRGVADFLWAAEELDRPTVGQYLGAEENGEALVEFVQQINFYGLDFDVALRRLVFSLHLPGEAQLISRIVTAFASAFVAQTNHQILRFTDWVEVLAFSVLMLNTDAHNPEVMWRMRKDQFIENNVDLYAVPEGQPSDTPKASGHGIGAGRSSDSLPTKFLEDVYQCVVQDEIVFEPDDWAWPNAVKRGWLRVGSKKEKRWGMLCFERLYVFRRIDDEEPVGLFALSDFNVKSSKNKHALLLRHLDHVNNDLSAVSPRGQGGELSPRRQLQQQSMSPRNQEKKLKRRRSQNIRAMSSISQEAQTRGRVPVYFRDRAHMHEWISTIHDILQYPKLMAGRRLTEEDRLIVYGANK